MSNLSHTTESLDFTSVIDLSQTNEKEKMKGSLLSLTAFAYFTLSGQVQAGLITSGSFQPGDRAGWSVSNPDLVSVTNTHVDVAKVPATSASMPTGISVPATLGLVLPGLAMLALQKKGGRGARRLQS